MKRLLITTLALTVISTALGARSNRQRTSIERAPNAQGTLTANYEPLIDRYFESLNETDRVDFAVVTNGKLDLVVGFFDYQRDVTKTNRAATKK